LDILIHPLSHRQRVQISPAHQGPDKHRDPLVRNPFADGLEHFRLGREGLLYGVSAAKKCNENYVVGKQWMWKFQHTTGQREINELHVPVGRKVKLIMATEDVIHDLFVPAFRIKTDVVPGKYTTEWFEATRPGRYHFFCAEYC